MQNPTAASTSPARASRGRRLWTDIKQAKTYYLLMLPALIYVLIFCYQPMYGLQIAFKDYKGVFGISGSPWVGLTHFISFFKGYYFWRLMKNTLIISLYSMVASFPLPIILALLLGVGLFAFLSTGGRGGFSKWKDSLGEMTGGFFGGRRRDK